MNVISMLIGLTALILMGVFLFSVGSMNGSEHVDEKEKLRRELAALNQRSLPAPLPKIEEPDPEAEKMAQLQLELEALKLEKERAEAESLAQEAASIVEEEEGEFEPAMDPADEKRLKRRANLIAQAMVMATVEQYYPPPDGFATMQIINYENVQEGVTLAIRRNTGIVGQLKVTTVESEKAVASVLDHTFLGGEVDIQPGDELILPPL